MRIFNYTVRRSLLNIAQPFPKISLTTTGSDINLAFTCPPDTLCILDQRPRHIGNEWRDKEKAEPYDSASGEK